MKYGYGYMHSFIFYAWSDLDDDEHPCPGECRLNTYRHKPKEENRV